MHSAQLFGLNKLPAAVAAAVAVAVAVFPLQPASAVVKSAAKLMCVITPFSLKWAYFPLKRHKGERTPVVVLHRVPVGLNGGLEGVPVLAIRAEDMGADGRALAMRGLGLDVAVVQDVKAPATINPKERVFNVFKRAGVRD